MFTRKYTAPASSPIAATTRRPRLPVPFQIVNTDAAASDDSAMVPML